MVALVVVELVAKRLVIVEDADLRVLMVEEPVEIKPLGMRTIFVVEVGARYPAASISQAWPNEAPTASSPQMKLPSESVLMVSQFKRRERVSPPFSICIPFPKVEVAVVD